MFVEEGLIATFPDSNTNPMLNKHYQIPFLLSIKTHACWLILLTGLFSLAGPEKGFSQIPDTSSITGINYTDSTITIAASQKYQTHFFGRLILGSHYRKVWSAPVTVPYLDIAHLKGGLTPLKMGGGLQTKSLRFLGADSNQYVIRTIDKDPSKTVAAEFRNTIVTDVIQDQISASHPYAFLVVADLSKAANIYHTNPRIFYVPDDPNLGAFRNDFKNRMVMFEERELTNASVEEGLTGFTKVKNTFDVYDAIHKNADNYVDEKFLLRSRLFDMMIGDWDRHEDQWLWAEFRQPDGRKMYRPIPRDRDQAFFTFDGVLPTIASLNVAATKKMQRYRPMPLSVDWFNFNGRNVDHNLLTRMTREDWKDMADSMLITITDQDIDKAFKVLPDTVYKLSAPEIIKTLKSRRNNLPIIADKYYEFLAKNVTVVGTNKQDYFLVKRSAPDITDISVYQYKDGVKGNLFYHRTFSRDETKQIQLYGLNSDDVFHVEGKAPGSPLLRIIGGKGNDTIVDQSSVGGFGKKTKVYDTKEGNFLSLGKEAGNKTSNDTAFNSYSPRTYTYNHKLFFPFFGYNADDGILLGAGLSAVTYGFKKGPCLPGDPCYSTAPYASRQTVGGDIAFKTLAFNFFYRGDFTDVIGRLDLNIQVKIKAPNSRYNFFGFGDTTKIIYPKEKYRLGVNDIQLFPALEAGNQNKIQFLFGPLFTQSRVTTDTTTTDTSLTFHDIFPDLSGVSLERKRFLGFNTQLVYEPFQPDSQPKFEVRFLVNLGYLKQIESSAINFGFVRGYVALFYNFYSSKLRTPVLTIATRFGGGYNYGDYEFYQANIIGGRSSENVRGFLGERFAGRSSLYNNLEARLRLFHFNAYFFPADFGIVGLMDNGRVWEDGENVNVIHTGYGGGLWISPFSLAVLTATYSFSDDQTNGLLNVKLGWWF